MPLVLALFAATCLSFFPAFFIPFVNTDEGAWATLGKYAFSGELYQNVIDHKPPFLFQLHWIMSGGESSQILLHIMTALWMFIGAYAFYKILLYFWDESRAKLAALLFALLGGVVNYATTAPERLYLPFLFLGVWMVLKVVEQKNPAKQIILTFFAGILFGCATCIKQPAFIFLAIPALLLLKTGVRKGLLLNLVQCIGILDFTWISWKLTHVPFETIWREAYAQNFTYMAVRAGPDLSQTIFNNVSLVLFLCYLPAVIGTGIFFIRIKNILPSTLTKEFLSRAILLLILILGSIWSVSLGGRFYQSYLIVLLPVLSILTALAVQWNSGMRKFLIGFSTFIAVGFCCWSLSRQVLDKNKNWDSPLKEVIASIDRDTLPSDTIWVHHAIPSIYLMSDRKPATRFLIFMHTIGYVDICTADEKSLKEDLSNLRYQELLSDLKMAKPKVIFWVHRNVNTCADRLKLKNFPSIESLIHESYDQKWANELGVYYIRRAS